MTGKRPVRTLVLATTRRSASRLRSMLPALGLSEWTALVPDYGAVAHMETQLGEIATRRRISDELHIAADTLRRPFVELTALFGRKYHSLAWWAMSIAERNTNGSDLFLHCCYLYLARRYLETGENLCLVCDAPALRASIVECARAKRYHIRQTGWRVPPLRETPVRPIAALLWKMAYVFLRWVVVKMATGGRTDGRQRKVSPDVLLSTWVDRGSLEGAGLVRDRYLPGLTQFYSSRGLTAATILTILEDVPTFYSIVRKLRKAADYILLEEHLRVSDLIFPIKVWRHQRAFRFGGATLRDLDVSRLFEAAGRTESLSVVATLHYPLMRRLALNGIRPRLVVLPFENMVFDKMTILGVRDSMPGTKVYGFCHNPLKRNVLAWYTDVHERDVAPLPDRVICNGRRYREILIREDYAPERVMVGTALRYAYLHRGGSQSSEYRPRAKGERPRVLLVLTTKRDGTLEVIDKFAAALANIDATILIKPHPFARELARGLVSVLGERARIVDGPMQEVLAAGDVVVCGASGAVLEAELAGKYVIRVSSECQLDMDPLAWFDDFDPPVFTSEELSRRLKEALSRTQGSAPPRRADGLSSFFAPPSEDHMEAFLPSDLPGRTRA